MIKNIVFDMGNVLLPFQPQTYLDTFVETDIDKELLMQEVFHSLEWLQMDTGDLDIPEALASVQERLPERLHEVARRLFYEWPEILPPIEGMEALVLELKGRGLHTYLLSNVGRYFYDIRRHAPAIRHMDGELISADCRIVKPFPGIYHELFDKFGLVPGECYFVDDSSLNIYGAMQVGMDGFVFHGDVDALRHKLREKGVLPQ